MVWETGSLMLQVVRALRSRSSAPESGCRPSSLDVGALLCSPGGQQLFQFAQEILRVFPFEDPDIRHPQSFVWQLDICRKDNDRCVGAGLLKFAGYGNAGHPCHPIIQDDGVNVVGSEKTDALGARSGC